MAYINLAKVVKDKDKKVEPEDDELLGVRVVEMLENEGIGKVKEDPKVTNEKNPKYNFIKWEQVLQRNAEIAQEVHDPMLREQLPYEAAKEKVEATKNMRHLNEQDLLEWAKEAKEKKAFIDPAIFKQADIDMHPPAEIRQHIAPKSTVAIEFVKPGTVNAQKAEHGGEVKFKDGSIAFFDTDFFGVYLYPIGVHSLKMITPRLKEYKDALEKYLYSPEGKAGRD